MTDKELLEMAAKAAGIEVTAVLSEGVPHRFGGGYWNPLTDDGDALRLAVKVRMDIVHFKNFVRADVMLYEYCNEENCREESCHEENGSDPYAATRCAIVRAAAEIGKAMP